MLKKAFVYLLLISSISYAQYWQSMTGQEDRPQTNSFVDTKSIQGYYQNIFQFNKKDNENPLMPNFAVDKEKILEKLKEVIPSDGPIDAGKYLVGPGDLLSIDIIGEIPLNFAIPVNPEGSLVIPGFGSVDLLNTTLSEAKQKISDKLKKQFLKGEIFATLVAPRIFTVSVGGIVENPGTYYASSVTRVENVIYQSNLLNPLEKTEQSAISMQERELLNRPDYLKYFNDEGTVSSKKVMSMRNIKVIRRNGDTLHVDLIRFYATGDNFYNPYLNDGDRVVVPNFSRDAKTLSISGSVTLNGTYEYTKYDSLSTMFEIAQGATADANLKKTVLFRYNNLSDKFEKIEIDLSKILTGQLADIKLLPNDRVVIPSVRDVKRQKMVMVKGEVVNPGIYPIIDGESTIQQVIDLSGGFLENASLSESKIIRFHEPLDNALLNPDYERLVNLRLSSLNTLDRQYYNFEAAIDRKFLSVDFTKLFIENDSTQNVTLYEGDVIIVPKKINAVYVYGQVVKPGYINYNENIQLEDYLNLAGGTTLTARESEIMVIKAGSKNWLEPDETNIQPGDAIWVPRERDTDFGFYFGWFSRIIAVLGGVATIILLISK